MATAIAANDDVKSHHLFFRTTPWFRQRVERAARYKSIKMAEYIRAAVIEKLERDEKVMGTGAGVGTVPAAGNGGRR